MIQKLMYDAHETWCVQTVVIMSRHSSCRTRCSDTQVRQVNSSVHPDRPCDPCILCKQGNNSKYFHPKSWKDSSLLEHLRRLEPSLEIQLESCICRLCRDDMKGISDENFIPRWKKVAKKNETKDCCIPRCTHVAKKVTRLVDIETIMSLFGVINDASNIPPSASSEHSEQGVGLCAEHYGALYRHLNPPNRKCKTCDKPLTDPLKSRKCPEPTLIQHFLEKNTNYSGEINADDRVCYACYRAHLFTIKHLSNTISSNDADLSHLLQQVKHNMIQLSDIHTTTQIISYATHYSAVYVGEILLKQNAILLPDVYDHFTDKVSDISRLRKVTIDEDEMSTTNPNWLRSQISSILEHHMAYRCSVKRYGTLLYRYGGDLLHALNVSLGQARLHQKSETIPTASVNGIDHTTLTEACLTLNSKFHACVNKMVKEDVTCPHSIEEFDIEKLISELDPDIWKAVCLLTQPLSSRAIKSADSSHVRNTRRLFCICTLLFTVNSQCSFPLHTLIADTIEACGGSTRSLSQTWIFITLAYRL